MNAVHVYRDHVIAIIEDAIKDGLIRTERLRTFRKNLKKLEGAELDAYLEKLWDKVGLYND